MEYTIIDKRTLADTLNFMGFRYMIFNRANRKIYSFENTEKFKFALYKVLELRKEINNY
ncbi:TPA: hypothetical protein PTW06_000902 [Clostridium botulinum]|nr:hypothetical protein [Clostridium botulinum]HDK7223616.1 hypothetical protein [Clostridium botulinum]HDK7271052.1 hypothetical protein [Clostridium botulinum]HDK7304408.1 hypothetical protein [Clostridium botulinum]